MSGLDRRTRRTRELVLAGALAGALTSPRGAWADEVPVHAWRVDGHAWSAFLVNDASMQGAYVFSPRSWLGVEGTLGWGISGPEVSAGVKLRYSHTRRFFVGVSEAAFVWPRGIGRAEYFGPYPGYMLYVDVLGYERHAANGAVFSFGLGTATLLHGFELDDVTGLTGVRLHFGVGRAF